MSETRTDNDFLIGGNGERLAPMMPVVITTRQQAYRTAAWLKLMASILPEESEASTFEQVERAIAST